MNCVPLASGCNRVTIFLLPKFENEGVWYEMRRSVRRSVLALALFLACVVVFFLLDDGLEVELSSRAVSTSLATSTSRRGQRSTPKPVGGVHGMVRKPVNTTKRIPPLVCVLIATTSKDSKAKTFEETTPVQTPIRTVLIVRQSLLRAIFLFLFFSLFLQDDPVGAQAEALSIR